MGHSVRRPPTTIMTKTDAGSVGSVCVALDFRTGSVSLTHYLIVFF